MMYFRVPKDTSGLVLGCALLTAVWAMTACALLSSCDIAFR